jgi:hypothetical protein
VSDGTRSIEDRINGLTNFIKWKKQADTEHKGAEFIESVALREEDGSVYVSLTNIDLPDQLDISTYTPQLHRGHYVKQVKTVRYLHTDGLTGHCECGECGQIVDMSDTYCKSCGAIFTVTKRAQRHV